MNKFTLTESEKNRILALHRNQLIVETIVISDWLSPDEKYCIFLDELYDIDKKIKIGNVFENFDNFIFFLKHCYNTAEHLTEEIRSTLLKSVNSIVINESNQDIRGIKPYIKQMLQEEWTANPFDKEFYSGENWKNALDAGTKTVQSGWEGLKKAYSNIKDGQWKEAFSIIAKGALYVARKIRSALYNPVIMILDAVLLATGIGKGIQFLPWAVAVMLDIYELTSGDVEDKSLSIRWRLFYFGIDILGMVSAGMVAKQANTTLGKLLNKFGGTDEGFAMAIKSSPFMKTTGENILSATKGASNLLQKAMTLLQKNAPMIYNFFKPVISGFGKFLKMLISIISGGLGLIKGALTLPGKVVQKVAPSSWAGTRKLAGATAAANVGVPIAGLELYQGYKTNKQTEDIMKALQNKAEKDMESIMGLKNPNLSDEEYQKALNNTEW